jgi:hypothetical protein
MSYKSISFTYPEIIKIRKLLQEITNNNKCVNKIFKKLDKLETRIQKHLTYLISTSFILNDKKKINEIDFLNTNKINKIMYNENIY